MGTRRPFRFGLLAEGITSREGLLDAARAAEDAGYATLLVRDHASAAPFGPQLAPLAALSTAGSATTRLRLGTHVLNADYWHPVLLAREAATLDLLSQGRLELGLGAGFLRAEYEQIGRRYDPPAVRVARFAESLRVLKGCFGDGPFTFSGAHFQVTQFDALPKPAQRPGPPILVAAGGRRLLSIAAREAEIIAFQMAPAGRETVAASPVERLPGKLQEKLTWVRRAAGQRFEQIELSLPATVLIAEDRHAAAERLARQRGWFGISDEQVLTMPSVFIGSLDVVAEQMHARRERYGVSYYVVPLSSLQVVAPLVARLAG